MTACEISAVWDKNSGQPPPSLHEFQAIWDTGATNSLISDAVVSNCQLIASGKAESHHAQGSAIVDTYLVNINIRLENTPVYGSQKENLRVGTFSLGWILSEREILP